ncbi:hypothetical protein [Hungatella sp. SL.1.14]|uniref:hypothetical protein n=1 Tax=Hungatella sp. SL.1.14 TaxID=2963703 RepID=UPI00204E160D|nr:hypothetical protein [Hungatella sp. SL.1.14]MCQ4833047.1 hypothetical protein [Hungatella sp. SL.1.14]DAO74915.1 MAG TPA: hypothetical protein [Caudoviricetes sp.]
MGRAYDIAERMKNGMEKPTVKIDDDHIYNINTGKSAVLYINAVSQDKEKDEFEKMDEVIKAALGKEALDYINDQDMAVASIALIVNVIMAAIADVSLEEVEEVEKNQKKSKRQ